MSLTAFMALCILGLDFMIFAFFRWIYGDKRSAVARQLAAFKNALKEQSHSSRAKTRTQVRSVHS